MPCRIIKWQCLVCGKEFRRKEDAVKCENEHFPDLELKKQIMINCINTNEDFCSTCEHVFYAYGCEQDCKYSNRCSIKNGWKDWKYGGTLNDVSYKSEN